MKQNSGKKSVQEEKENINSILAAGLNAGRVSQSEVENAKALTSWNSLQPILDKAQGTNPPTAGEKLEALETAKERLKMARKQLMTYREICTIFLPKNGTMSL